MVRSVGIRKSALPTGMDAYRTDQITSRKHGKSQPRLLLVSEVDKVVEKST